MTETSSRPRPTCSISTTPASRSSIVPPDFGVLDHVDPPPVSTTDRRVHDLARDGGDRRMTVRVTTLKGTDAGRYYVEGLPSYYLDSGEPPGRWHGDGAEMLGLGGELEQEAFLRVMAGEHPVTGRKLGTRFCERSARGFDVTCSAPKSVSVLFG